MTVNAKGASCKNWRPDSGQQIRRRSIKLNFNCPGEGSRMGRSHGHVAVACARIATCIIAFALWLAIALALRGRTPIWWPSGRVVPAPLRAL